MPDEKMLEKAREIESLASFCKDMKEAIKKLDVIINHEIDRFLLSHHGETPDVLRANYYRWKDSLLESLPYLDSIAAKCNLATVI